MAGSSPSAADAGIFGIAKTKRMLRESSALQGTLGLGLGEIFLARLVRGSAKWPQTGSAHHSMASFDGASQPAHGALSL